MYAICHALYITSICVYFTVLHGTIALVYHALEVMMNIHIHVHVRTYACTHTVSCSQLKYVAKTIVRRHRSTSHEIRTKFTSSVACRPCCALAIDWSVVTSHSNAVAVPALELCRLVQSDGRKGCLPSSANLGQSALLRAIHSA